MEWGKNDGFKRREKRRENNVTKFFVSGVTGSQDGQAYRCPGVLGDVGQDLPAQRQRRHGGGGTVVGGHHQHRSGGRGQPRV